MWNDFSFGYILYRAGQREQSQGITGIFPIFEVHINTPLNNRGALSGPNGSPDEVVLTQGLAIEINRRCMLTFAVGEPITGFKQYDLEGIVQLNYRW
jgi:hypothetical protein